MESDTKLLLFTDLVLVVPSRGYTYTLKKEDYLKHSNFSENEI